MARESSIYIGVSPPPSTDVLWLDTSVAGSTIDPSGGSRRTPFATPTVSYCTGYSAEPSLQYIGGSDPYWSIVYYAGDGVIAYAQTRDPSSTDPYAWVHAPTAIAPGVTYFDHQCVHEKDGTLYYIGALGTGATTMRLWTAPTPAFGSWPVWTDRGNMSGVSFSSGINGNASLAWLPNGKVIMLLETLQAGQWRTGVYTADTPLGPWALLQVRLEELQPGTSYGYSGPWPVVENNGITLLYHSSMVRPSVGLKARTTFNGFQNFSNWTPLSSMTNPFISRQHPVERDQVADLTCAQTPDGFGWAAWSGNCNAANSQSVLLAPLIPTLKAWAGNWTPVSTGYNPHQRREWVETAWISNADGVVAPGEYIFFRNLAADRICTLPRASHGCRVKIVVGGNSGAFGVTPTVLAGNNTVTGTPDTIETSAAAKILMNQTRTLACYEDGTWQMET